MSLPLANVFSLFISYLLIWQMNWLNSLQMATENSDKCSSSQCFISQVGRLKEQTFIHTIFYLRNKAEKHQLLIFQFVGYIIHMANWWLINLLIYLCRLNTCQQSTHFSYYFQLLTVQCPTKISINKTVEYTYSLHRVYGIDSVWLYSHSFGGKHVVTLQCGLWRGLSPAS